MLRQVQHEDLCALHPELVEGFSVIFFVSTTLQAIMNPFGKFILQCTHHTSFVQLLRGITVLHCISPALHLRALSRVA